MNGATMKRNYGRQQYMINCVLDGIWCPKCKSLHPKNLKEEKIEGNCIICNSKTFLTKLHLS